MELITGRVVGHKDGFGFVVPDEGGDDLFPTLRQMRGVMHGDRVVVRVSGIDQRGRREGIVAEVLEHAVRQAVGRYFIKAGVAYLEPANQRITQEILIPPKARQGAKNGQMVVVELTTYPTAHSPASGKIVEVLGEHMAPGWRDRCRHSQS